MRRLLSVLIILSVTSVPVHADDAPPLKLERGTRLRLFVDGQRIDGRIREADDRTITVDTGGGQPARFLRDQVSAVMYRTVRRDRGKGATIGAVITGLAGIVACGVALNNEEKRKGEPSKETRGQGVGLILATCYAVGALPGAGIGFAIGAPASDWHGLSPHGFTMAGAAPPRRATAALTVRFGR
jgi:hypothetical protein